jgi:hypothetical protein
LLFRGALLFVDAAAGGAQGHTLVFVIAARKAGLPDDSTDRLHGRTGLVQVPKLSVLLLFVNQKGVGVYEVLLVFGLQDPGLQEDKPSHRRDSSLNLNDARGLDMVRT